MGAFEEFEQSLRDALPRLYEPAYRPSDLLCAALGIGSSDSGGRVQAAIFQAIESLRPAATVPAGARIRRIYEVLSCRYVQRLTQEETAARLDITPRHLRRQQQQAVSMLAWHLWRQSPAKAQLVEPLASTGDGQAADLAAAEAEVSEWRSQVRQELASLNKSAPGGVTDVCEGVEGAVELVRVLASGHGVELKLGTIEAHLVVAVHPSVLRQALIKSFTELIRHMSAGQVELTAGRIGDRAKILLTGCPVLAPSVPDDQVIRELVSAQGGTVQVHADGHKVSFCIDLPTASKVTVLVIDDNVDLVHFYQRFALGTRYHVVGSTKGTEVMQTIEALAPSIIVLDVMLPDVDGWDLLARLHQHPLAQSIPVIVCSVIKEEELSLALGAVLFLPKPVRRQQFIRALDQALRLAEAGVLRGPASSGIAG